MSGHDWATIRIVELESKVAELEGKWKVLTDIAESDGTTPDDVIKATELMVARSQKPRPMDEAPRDGTMIQCFLTVRFHELAWRGKEEYQVFIDSEFNGWTPTPEGGETDTPEDIAADRERSDAEIEMGSGKWGDE